MRKCYIRACLSMIFLSACVVVFAGSSVFAEAIGIYDVDVLPPSPLVGESIAITTYGWNGYAVNFSFYNSDFSISGNDIVLNTYFIDPDPLSARIPIADDWQDTQNIGSLTAGTYNVTSQAWEILGYGGWPELSDTFTTSFLVIPEPATVLMLTLGGLVLLRKRNS